MAENRREEQKLWLILFQIKAIRTRLNLLVVQYWLFATIAVLGGAAALILAAALAFSPLFFLAFGMLVCLAGIIGTARVGRIALHRAADRDRAAAEADRRTGLKGRLSAVLALADAPPSSALWPYLVEDTYALRQKFEPAAVEPRWVSRAVFAPAIVLTLGAAMLMVVKYQRALSAGAGMPPAEMTADLGNLEIQPADPSLPANAHVVADPATLRQLAARLARADKDASNHSGVERWLDRARHFAGTLQDQVTGQKPLAIPPLALRLRSSTPPTTGKDEGHAARPQDNVSHPSPGTSGSSELNQGGGAGSGDSRPPANLSRDDANRFAHDGLPSAPGVATESTPGGPEDQPGAGNVDADGTADHGPGSDPEHLFGPPSTQPLGSDSFKLTVDARPIDESSSGGAPAYMPPKVRVPLNPEQSSDEPLARASIPYSDRATIKRVFER